MNPVKLFVGGKLLLRFLAQELPFHLENACMPLLVGGTTISLNYEGEGAGATTGRPPFLRPSVWPPSIPPTHSLSPPKSPPFHLALGQQLPYEILSRIFVYAARAPRQQDWGGVFVSWQSNEEVGRLALVCKNWRLAAQHVLFRSCSLLSAKDAHAFVEVTKKRRDLAAKVCYLVVGLSEEEETWPSTSQEDVTETEGSMPCQTRIGTSAVMVEALQACPSLRHLQICPLHDSAREGILGTLIQCRALETLVCCPRLRKPAVDWTGCLFRQDDIEILVLPTLRNLELDAWTPVPFAAGADESLASNASLLPINGLAPDLSPPAPSKSHLPSLSPFASPSLSIMSAKLVTLRLRFDITDEHLFALLAAVGSTLERADIYLERLVPPEVAARALAHSLGSLRELRWTTNPPLEEFDVRQLPLYPLFDRVLAHFNGLEYLSISATDISPAALSLLPPSLMELDIQAFAYRGRFTFSEEMIKTLESRSSSFALKLLTVRDSGEVWSAENVDAMTAACAARGIIFDFVADEDVEADSG